MKKYLVWHEGDLETEYFVDAESPEQAADIYMKAAIDEIISVIADDFAPDEFLLCREILPTGEQPGIIFYEQMEPVEIQIKDIPAVVSFMEEVGFEP